MLVLAGVILTAGFGVWLFLLAVRGEPWGSGPPRFPRYGWCGLVAMAALEILLALRVSWVTTFFTALIWPAYIVTVDAAVFRLRRRSLLHQPGAFLAMALLSIPAWLIFEAYNFRLRNWEYVGVPQHFAVFALGAGVAFATILPGILETAELFHASWTHRIRWPSYAAPARLRGASTVSDPGVVLGAALLLVPLLVPARWGAYLFAPVWLGFVFLLDPISRRRGWPSLLGDLEDGRPGWFLALLLGGAACGFFWEFWNFWAQARWVYVFPIFHRYRIFAMPVPGFIGFPPFALECFTLYVLLSRLLLPARYRCRFSDESRPAARPATPATPSR